MIHNYTTRVDTMQTERPENNNLRGLWYFLDWPFAFPVIVFVGLIIRVVFLIYIKDYPLFGDAFAYHNVAIDAIKKNQFIPWWNPGVSLYLLLFHSLIGNDSQFASQVSMLPIYIALCAGVFLLVNELSNRKAANLTVTIIAFYPESIFQSIIPLSQLPAAAILVIVVYLLIYSARNFSYLLSIILGILLGILTLFRSSNLLLTIIMPIVLFRFNHKSRYAIIVGVLGLGIASAWVYRIYHNTGHFILICSSNPANLYFGNNKYTPLYKTWWFASHSNDPEVCPEFKKFYQATKKLPMKERNKAFYQQVLGDIMERPGAFIIRTINRIKTFFAFDTFCPANLYMKYKLTYLSIVILIMTFIVYTLLISLAILFLVSYQNREISRSSVYLILLIILLTAFPYFIAFSHPTYHFPILPFVFAFAAIFVEKYFSSEIVKNRIINMIKSKKYYVILFILLFLYIQIEWIYFNYSRVID
jgi:hypothetical protein